MQRITLLLCATVFALSGCGMGKSQNPVGSDDEMGSTRAEAEEAKPSTYVTSQGDTLRSIASRGEIYADAELWPLLLDANEYTLGSVGPGKRLEEGLVLEIPRVLDLDDMDEAREKARQYAAATKARVASVKRPEPEPTLAAPTPEAAAVPTQEVAPAPLAPQAVPKAKSGGMLPILFLLLLVLAALGAVLYVFSRRDKQDKA